MYCQQKQKIETSEIMQRIAVRPPYFALQDMIFDSQVLRAKITAEQPLIDGELGTIGTGEIARHLAIAGSCACSYLEKESELIYYLATQADFHNFDTIPQQKDKDFLIEAQGKRLNKREAETISLLKSFDGKTVYSSLKTRFLLLPYKSFSKLYKTHRKDLRMSDRTQTTAEDRQNIYKSMFKFDSKIIDNKIISQIKIKHKYCMGHFPEYPAFPVAFCSYFFIMLMKKFINKNINFYVKRGIVNAQNLIFTNEIIDFEAELKQKKNNEYNFICKARNRDIEKIRIGFILGEF